ncbi:MAG TPA: DUF5906 domain-containing protein [Saprospiraceae bacterium]|nr:DUF5906 domain-containing protein [Saprospiraceae bacterium]HMP13480.1 DUF5906 domain-containing protein [Saprospiraceae bacterium]
MSNFYEERMAALGVTEQNNLLRAARIKDTESLNVSIKDAKLFTQDSQGNIIIHYFDIEGSSIPYKTNEKYSKVRMYQVKRLREPIGDMKYKMPAGAGTYPWFHPTLIAAFFELKKIDTLYLTEGVFKAFKACELGIPTVAFSSITHHSDNTGQIHRDVLRLIETCNIEKIVILWDGDCLDISKKAIPVREELTKRPFGFFNAAKTIRERILKAFPNLQVFFMHPISDSFPQKPKGLDDILIVAEKVGELEKVVEDVVPHDRRGKYFFRMDITSTTEILAQYFCLTKFSITEFYNRHCNIIGESDFYFHQNLYYYDNSSNELRLIAPGWAQNLRWIGDEFFVEMQEPSARGDRRALRKYSKETLRDLYGKNFLQYLKHFAGFCNVPSHTDYQQVIERGNRQFYNRYYPIRHVPEPGDYSKIIDFIKHIWGEYEVVHAVTGTRYLSWHLGLDYLQLLYLKPTQALPVICLYSKENATGKSLFGKLIAGIFGDNYVQIGNSDLQSDFNEHYIDKLVAVCEETLLERKRDVERIKALSTSGQIMVNPKGQKQYTIDIFLKFIFMSNNLRMIYVTQHDERFWIHTVPKPKKDNPNLEEEMLKQIPAFLDFLNHRVLETKKEGRMHFHPSLIRTQTFEQVVEVNEPTDATDLRERMRDLFLSQPPGDLPDVIEMTLKEVKAEFFGGKASDKWIKEILSDYLKVDLRRDEAGGAIYTRGAYLRHYYEPSTGEWTTKEVKWRGRPYQFYKKDFLLDGEVGEWASEEDEWIPEKTF